MIFAHLAYIFCEWFFYLVSQVLFRPWGYPEEKNGQAHESWLSWPNVWERPWKVFINTQFSVHHNLIILLWSYLFVTTTEFRLSSMGSWNLEIMKYWHLDFLTEWDSAQWDYFLSRIIHWRWVTRAPAKWRKFFLQGVEALGRVSPQMRSPLQVNIKG